MLTVSNHAYVYEIYPVPAVDRRMGHADYAESAVVSYIIARARAVSNPGALARQLEEQVDRCAKGRVCNCTYIIYAIPELLLCHSMAWQMTPHWCILWVHD